MNIALLNETIRNMCAEVTSHCDVRSDWQQLNEEELLFEAAVCIFGSQMVYEFAVASAERLRESGLLRPVQFGFNRAGYETRIAAAFSEPLALRADDGTTRWVRPRFKNRMASLLATTVAEIHGQGRSIREMLLTAVSAKDARGSLIQHVWGFGPKQASLFLRRIGYCADFAVLDIHVMDYLRIARGLTLQPSKLGCLSFYERVEDEFRKIAIEFGHTLGCVDLATWLTMRVAKREAYL